MVLVIGISGASGAIYGIRLLEVLYEIDTVETHLVITAAAEVTIEHETSYSVADVRRLANTSYDICDIGAALASGSFRRHGMIVAPCSVKTLAALAHSFGDNLLTRAADVTLKERKPLAVMVRETPLHLGHLRNMVALAEMGAIICPPLAAFYNKPQSVTEIVNGSVGRVLDLFDIHHNLSARWPGL